MVVPAMAGPEDDGVLNDSAKVPITQSTRLCSFMNILKVNLAESELSDYSVTQCESAASI